MHQRGQLKSKHQVEQMENQKKSPKLIKKMNLY